MRIRWIDPPAGKDPHETGLKHAPMLRQLRGRPNRWGVVKEAYTRNACCQFVYYLRHADHYNTDHIEFVYRKVVKRGPGPKWWVFARYNTSPKAKNPLKRKCQKRH